MILLVTRLHGFKRHLGFKTACHLLSSDGWKKSDTFARLKRILVNEQ